MIQDRDDLVAYLVHDVAHLMRLRIDRKLKKHNLTRVSWLALGILKSKPDLTQRELAGKMELGDAATGRLVDRLQHRRLLERVLDPNDRRVRKLALTPKARALLTQLEGVSHGLREEILDGLPEEDLVAVETGLQKMKSNLRGLLGSIPTVAWIQHELQICEISIEFLALAQTV